MGLEEQLGTSGPSVQSGRTDRDLDQEKQTPSMKHFQRNQHELDGPPAKTSILTPQHYTLHSASVQLLVSYSFINVT